MPETRTYRRSELYEQVWAKPVRGVAKEYGVSDVALAKICRRLAVPLPGVGYWARKRAGKPTRRTPLGVRPPEVPEEIVVEVPRTVAASLPPDAAAAIARIQRPEAAILVPDTLAEPHELVVQARRLLRHEKSHAGRVSCRSARCLDIAVSHKLLHRALRIFDALLRAFEALGFAVQVTDPEPTLPWGSWQARNAEPPPYATRVQVAGEWIRIKLEEGWLPRPRPKSWRDPSPPWVPSGLLSLHIDEEYLPGRSVWRDGKRQRIEHCLNDFVAGLYVKGEAKHAKRVEREERDRRDEEAAERRRQEERRTAEEARRAEVLGDQVARWRLARDLRAFAQEARQMVESAHCSIRAGGWVDEIVTWGEAYAKKIDPLSPLAKELSDHVKERESKRSPSPTNPNAPASEP